MRRQNRKSKWRNVVWRPFINNLKLLEIHMRHLERALDNQNSWWKYLVVFIVASLAEGLAAGIGTYAVVTYENRGDFPFDAFAHPENFGFNGNLRLLVVLLSFVAGFAVFIKLCKKWHKRSLAEIINGTNVIRWSRFFYGALIWGALSAAMFLASYLIDPGNFQWNFKATTFIPLVLISVLGIPLQACFEEVSFRGYFAQGFAAWTRSRWMVLFGPAFLFALAHSVNPEVTRYGFWSTMPSYLLFGLTFGLISILDDGIELTMGAHTVNNIFASVVVTFKSSVLETPALFYQNELYPLRDTVLLALSSIVFVAILGKKYKWDYSILNKRVRSNQPEEILIEPFMRSESSTVV